MLGTVAENNNRISVVKFYIIRTTTNNSNIPTFLISPTSLFL